MYLSEHAFPHLVATADAAVAAELERRRVAAERRDEQRQEPSADDGAPGDGTGPSRARRTARGWSAQQLLHPVRGRHA